MKLRDVIFMENNIREKLSLFVDGAKIILGHHMKKIILYGSYARGDYRENSDIDLMILTDLNDKQIEHIENGIYDLAYDYMLDYGLDISVAMKNETHYNDWLETLPYYRNIQKEGIVLAQ